MAININDVYKSVLVVLQQEKRGVLTPTEFNKIAAQSQQEIYNQYFDDLNQLLRLPQTTLAYADRFALLDEKISLFKRTINKNTDAATQIALTNVQELGSVVYFETETAAGRESQRIQKQDVYTVNQSPLTEPTKHYPVYTYENNIIQVYPNSGSGSIGVGPGPVSPGPGDPFNFQINYLAFPEDPIWGFDIEPNLGNYIYNAVKSTDFEIHQSDQPLLIDKILGYAGVMTKDQLALSLAAQKEQQITVDNQK
jgi:hypothetical protein